MDITTAQDILKAIGCPDLSDDQKITQKVMVILSRYAWPRFYAPKQYPDYPLLDETQLPDFEKMFAIAKACGYSIGLHGSMKRDVDLIAAPWTDEACDADELIKALCEGMDLLPTGTLEKKPHGRVAMCLQPKHVYSKLLDLSIMPKSCTHLYGIEHDRVSYNPDRPSDSMTAVCLKCGFKPKGEMYCE